MEKENEALGSLQLFLQNFSFTRLMALVISVAASLLCITIHELCHGLAAWRLGDPTARAQGRLTLNPLHHIDPLGLLLMITAGVGWARPVPVDMRYFRHPKRDMAITALAGPVSNFLLALVAMAGTSLVWRVLSMEQSWEVYLLLFLLRTAVLSVGLGIFNLIPIPPLDGSRVLFALLPDRLYYGIMRYERYVMIVMLLAVWLGVFDRPLSFLIYGGVRLLGALTGVPLQLLYLL